MDLELLPQGADQAGEDAAACPQVTALAIRPALPEGSWLPPQGAGKSSFFRTPGFRENQWHAEKNLEDSPFALLLLVILQKSATSLSYFSILHIYKEIHKQVKKKVIAKYCQPADKMAACPDPCRWGYISDKTLRGLFKNRRCFC